MSNYFGYIRVSTIRQGEHGVSLQEQRDAISRYAAHEGITITEWYEERLTAAKLGRPVFSRMLKGLRQGRAGGVVMHKIDRSARNLRDWSNLGELIDQGLDIRFAHDNVDLHSRGGRLSADIQAVVAADYIRNLREETRKGFYGRLKQGLYPLAAPVGYCNNGKGQPKTPCPKNAPLVKQLFELYVSGQYPLTALADEMHARGLRSRTGRRIPRSMIAVILKNPFYVGLLRVRSTGEVFPGVHEPLIRRRVFEDAQLVLGGRMPKRKRVHSHLFRRLFTCSQCENLLIGERQKGHVYYRCQTRACRQTSLREEVLDEAVRSVLTTLTLSDEEFDVVSTEAQLLDTEQAKAIHEAVQSLRIQVEGIAARLDRLTDAYLDQAIDKTTYQSRQASLLQEQQQVKERLRDTEAVVATNTNQLQEFLELVKSLSLLYELGTDDEKREVVKNVFSNQTAFGKDVVVTPHFPFQVMAKRPPVLDCAQYLTTTRTFLTRLLEALVQGPRSWGQFSLGGVGKKGG